MAYQKYTGLTSPNAILEKIAQFAADNGWMVLENCIDDLSIDGSGSYDGKKVVLKSPDSSVLCSFRSANGKPIFKTQKNTGNAHGIGLVCYTAYTANPPSGFWYDQPNATKNTAGEVIGAGIPVKPNGSHTLYLNTILDPKPMLVVSVQLNGVFQHLAVGTLEKVGAWNGGLIYSGSRNSINMFTASAGFDATTMETESNPLFAFAPEASTFLRMDIDAAPLRAPSVLWASAGQNSGNHYTGKQMALPVKKLAAKGQGWDANIPDYTKLQSQNATDTGRNVNTLNCITVNMNLTAYVLRDPDGLRNFSPVGYVPGVYFISTRNVAPGSCYEISYPHSGQLHQAFPYTRRRGVYGFDGFSVKQ